MVERVLPGHTRHCARAQPKKKGEKGGDPFFLILYLNTSPRYLFRTLRVNAGDRGRAPASPERTNAPTHPTARMHACELQGRDRRPTPAHVKERPVDGTVPSTRLNSEYELLKECASPSNAQATYPAPSTVAVRGKADFKLSVSPSDTAGVATMSAFLCMYISEQGGRRVGLGFATMAPVNGMVELCVHSTATPQC